MKKEHLIGDTKFHPVVGLSLGYGFIRTNVQITISQVANLAIQKEGSQENVAIKLDLAPSALSKRINGDVGWSEKDIERLCGIAGVHITDCSEYQGQIDKLRSDIVTLKNTIRILMEE